MRRLKNGYQSKTLLDDFNSDMRGKGWELVPASETYYYCEEGRRCTFNNSDCLEGACCANGREATLELLLVIQSKAPRTYPAQEECFQALTKRVAIATLEEA